MFKTVWLQRAPAYNELWDRKNTIAPHVILTAGRAGADPGGGGAMATPLTTYFVFNFTEFFTKNSVGASSNWKSGSTPAEQNIECKGTDLVVLPVFGQAEVVGFPLSLCPTSRLKYLKKSLVDTSSGNVN